MDGAAGTSRKILATLPRCRNREATVQSKLGNDVWNPSNTIEKRREELNSEKSSSAGLFLAQQLGRRCPASRWISGQYSMYVCMYVCIYIYI